MKKIAADCVKATYGKMEPMKRTFSFELFGLDYMLDDNNKVYLIEVNTNPSLSVSCPMMARFIPSVIENTFRIAVDPVFPPPTFPKAKRHMIPDNVYETNKFELIFDELVDGPDLQQLNQNKNAPNSMDLIQEDECEDEPYDEDD